MCGSKNIWFRVGIVLLVETSVWQPCVVIVVWCSPATSRRHVVNRHLITTGLEGEGGRSVGVISCSLTSERCRSVATEAPSRLTLPPPPSNTLNRHSSIPRISPTSPFLMFLIYAATLCNGRPIDCSQYRCRHLQSSLRIQTNLHVRPLRCEPT